MSLRQRSRSRQQGVKGAASPGVGDRVPVTRSLDLFFEELVVRDTQVSTSCLRRSDFREELTRLLGARLGESSERFGDSLSRLDGSTGSSGPVGDHVAEAVAESIALISSSNAAGRVT
jgi:hypothetical protein